MSIKNIVVLGSVNQDHTVQAPRLPTKGETVMGHRHVLARGGKGANQAVAAGRLGAQVDFISCMGDDGFARDALIAFEADGINIEHITLCENHNTGIALILVDDNGGNCIAISPNANNKLTAEVVDNKQDTIAKADYLLLQLETPLDGVERAVDIARENHAKVVLNPAPARPLPDSLLAKLDLITPNETEAEVLTGIKVTDEASATVACQHFIEKGVKEVIITMGSQGAFLYRNGQGTLIPGFRVDATDTTAAGDTFNGALLVALSEGQSMEDAVVFAHRASAISVTRMGAQTSIPYRHELDAIVELELK
ncbi:ribokinase [Shewanella sp. NFH-SH190041]|uniref:ribokinase n=1 Tax=Shewanella sp. NFH-SH190041 TaxID=2950245 RepID=UPI0021FE765B|nr:ribokinase [Shewanella sp. NFH-SH190041]BDM63589.1 ribokinase [Shewanella sp. NFH-SH190041]